MKILFLLLGINLTLVPFLYATPSTQIWNPSTDIQAQKTGHLGIDNYYSVVNNANTPYALGTDVGFTYGLVKNLEVGIDVVEPSVDPLLFNAKYGLPEGETAPALALGVFNAGTKQDVTNYNIIYGVAAKTFQPVGRFSVGYYSGNEKLLLDENGKKANTGVIASWDKTLTDKIWVSLDYASGNSAYGSFSPGFSYLFASNVSVIFGYVFYNNATLNRNNHFTTQLDINF
jgi:hypothetical protein